ncbi:MAG: hypothetical protein ACI8W8_005130, partial [Rhodothermales bacterium]
ENRQTHSGVQSVPWNCCGDGRYGNRLPGTFSLCPLSACKLLALSRMSVGLLQPHARVFKNAGSTLTWGALPRWYPMHFHCPESTLTSRVCIPGSKLASPVIPGVANPEMPVDMIEQFRRAVKDRRGE